MRKTSSLPLAEKETQPETNGTNRSLQRWLLAAGLFLDACATTHADPVPLGAAANVVVLTGSAVTFTGLTVIYSGNVGVSAGASGGSVAQQAETDLSIAFNDAAGLTPTQVLTGENLGGLTLTPGVCFFSAVSQLTGTWTPNDQGDPNAIFVFQIGSTLTTAATSSVVTVNGGPAAGSDVFWQAGSSALLGAGTAFEGNILASGSVTANAGATNFYGRLLAESGAVALDDNSLAVPPAPSAVLETSSALLLLSFVSAVLIALRPKTSESFSNQACSWLVQPLSITPHSRSTAQKSKIDLIDNYIKLSLGNKP
jgi:hypothetical protein